MTDNITSQNTDFSFWITLCLWTRNCLTFGVYTKPNAQIRVFDSAAVLTL